MAPSALTTNDPPSTSPSTQTFTTLDSTEATPTPAPTSISLDTTVLSTTTSIPAARPRPKEKMPFVPSSFALRYRLPPLEAARPEKRRRLNRPREVVNAPSPSVGEKQQSSNVTGQILTEELTEPSVDAVPESSSEAPPKPRAPYAHLAVELRAIRGLGSGVFSRHKFSPSDVIFAEKPLVKANKGATARELLDEIRTLDKQHLLLLLTFEAAGGPSDRALEAIFRSNAIPCVEDDEEDPPCAMFKYLSRINHSCAPNSGWFWNEHTQQMMVIAYRPIAVGDEITASYCDFYTLCQSREKRLSDLKASHFFRCKCRACISVCPPLSIAEYHLQKSDSNRARLGTLLRKWDNVDITTLVLHGHRTTLGETNEAIGLADAETLISSKVYIYLTQFYIQAARGDYDEAKTSASNALENLAAIRGPEAAARHWIADIANDPKRWESWGVCAVGKS